MLCIVKKSFSKKQEVSANAGSSDLGATVMRWRLIWGGLPKESARVYIPKNISFLEYNMV